MPPQAVNEIAVTVQGRRKIGEPLEERVDPRGRPYYWIGNLRSDDPGEPDADLTAVNAGAIAVTPLYLDLTHRPMLETLRGVFA